MSALLQALAEQQKLMEGTGQPAMSPQEYLYASTLSRPHSSLSQGRVSQPASPSRSVAPLSPSRVGGCVSPSRSIAVSSPERTGNANAILEGTVTEVDAHPATGYPAAADAYMNNLPQELYSPKVFLPRHVTDTLELCLKVLKRNEEERRGRLSARDEDLIMQIASFGSGALPSEAPEEVALVESPIKAGAVGDEPSIAVHPCETQSADPAEAGLRDAKY